MSNFQSAFSSQQLEESEIAKHPLFPVLKFLLERCDTATEKFGVSHVPLNSIDAEIEAMVHKCVGEAGSITYPDQEVHNLVILTLQVLRIHLLELEKVGELCVDFSTRYINCLKQKMQAELLSSELLQDGTEEASNTSGDSMFESYQQSNAINKTSPPDAPSTSTPLFSPAGVMPPFGNVSCDPLNLTPQYTFAIQPSHSANRRNSLNTATPNFDPLSEGTCCRKRGVLPKHATHVMRQWLFQHLMHPYPKESEKQIMASQTGLSLLQVNNWFINARRRVLQPIMDRSNPPLSASSASTANAGSARGKHKKSSSSQCGGGGGASSSGAVNRFWPEKLRNVSAAAPLVESTAMSSSSSSSSGSIINERQQPPQAQQTAAAAKVVVHPGLAALLPGIGFISGNENRHLMSMVANEEQTWMVTAAGGEAQ